MPLNKESHQENKTYKVLWDFEIETDDPIPGKRPQLGWIP